MKLAGLMIATLFTTSLSAQSSVERPRIIGIAHVAFRVGDLAKARSFYGGFLGYNEPFALKDTAGNVAISFIKVNDQQYVELFPSDEHSRGQLDHFAIYTDNLAVMRNYLLSRSVGLREDVHRGRLGNYFLTIQDPDGHPLEILQYTPDSLTGRSKGKFMPAGRISTHITHVGISVASIGAATRFYRDILGFQEFARGIGSDGQPTWIDLRLANSDDYIEFIPVDGVPSPNRLKAVNHICFASTDVRKTVDSLQVHGGAVLMGTAIEVQAGDNLPVRANLFDPDGARIEIMEAQLGAGATQ